MDYETWNSKVLGVVIDTSLRHIDGKRFLDHIKENLIQYLRDDFDDDDVFYLFHPEIVEAMDRKGEAVASVSNFETDGWSFRLNYALQQTLYVLEAEEGQRRLVLFTDRFNSIPIERLALLKEREEIDCEIFVFCVGDCDHHKMSLCDVNLVRIDDATKISDKMKEFLKYGTEHAGCDSETCEGCE